MNYFFFGKTNEEVQNVERKKAQLEIRSIAKMKK
jgi:hypothetical protein